MSRIRLKALFCILLSALLTAGAGSVLSKGLDYDFESRTWDLRLRLLSRFENPDPKIKIVMIDQTSLDTRAREESQFWPWPRSLYIPLIRFLEQSGARGLAIDMLFTEDSLWGVDDDEAFAAAMRSRLPIVTALALRETATLQAEDKLELFQSRQKALSEPIASLFPGRLRSFPFATLPVEPVLVHAPYFANVSAQPDEGGVFRRVSPASAFRDIAVPNLAFGLYLATQSGLPTALPVSARADADGQYLIRFLGPVGTYPWYSIDAIIQSYAALREGTAPPVSPEEFKDAFVFLGTNAPGLLDLRPTPLSAVSPGVELNATVLDNLLHDRFLQEIPLWVSILAAGVAVLLTTLAAVFVTQIPVQAVLILSIAGSWLLGGVGLTFAGYWLPLVTPLTAIVVAALTSLFFVYELEGRERRFLSHAFGHYVSPEVIQKIIRDPKHLTLGGERRELSIFFSDIAGFTTLSEKMDPAVLSVFLNRFLSEMTDIILESGGTIDKYEGDAIIAFWNAPLDVPDHRRRAVEAALHCQVRLNELAPVFKEEYDAEVVMRCGVHTGVVTVGNFGSKIRFNYTMIGDAANLASRLEGANKPFGTRMLVSETTRSGAEDCAEWRKVASLRVVGRKEAVPVYEPLNAILSAPILAHLPEYRQALESFEAGKWDEALARFSALAAHDPVAAAYERRIREEGTGSDRDPVWNLTAK